MDVSLGDVSLEVFLEVLLECSGGMAGDTEPVKPGDRIR